MDDIIILHCKLKRMRLSSFKLAAFDLDGTLTIGDPSWVMVHKSFGTMHVGEEGERLYSNGKISYREFILKDISAWPNPLRKDRLKEILRSYRLRDDAEYVMNYLRSRGLKTAILTAALDIIAKDIARKLKVDYVYANRLGFDKDGYFDGRIYAIVEPLRKHNLLSTLCSRLNIGNDQVIAVGDTSYDISFLKAAGLGFLIGNRELALKNNLIPIEKLSDIISYFS